MSSPLIASSFWKFSCTGCKLHSSWTGRKAASCVCIAISILLLSVNRLAAQDSAANAQATNSTPQDHAPSVEPANANENGGETDTSEQKSSAPSRSKVIVERNIVFREVGGETLKADIYRPDAKGKHPMILMVHGGAWALGDKWDLIGHGMELAKAGYIAVSVNYRLAPKYKMAEQLDDCRFAMKWMQERASDWNGDTDRFVLWGYSAGAHLVSMLALSSHGSPATEEIPITAVVAGGAPCEFSFVSAKSRMLAYVMGGSREEVPEVYAKFSPVQYVTEEAPPYLLFHGSKDLLVPQSSSRALYEQLLEHGIAAEYISVENMGHLMTFLDPQTRKKVIRFLDSKCKDSPEC